jgi:uncharacterized protein (DUF2147 family)
MRRVLFLLAAFAALGAASDPPVEPAAVHVSTGLDGQWRNTRDTVHLRLSECGEGICGTVTWAVPQARADARRGSGQDLIGKSLFREFEHGDDGKWHGKIFIPDLNANASATIVQVDRDTLLVSGCVFLKLACKTQHWWRLR